jgi:hypothetical protein
VVTCAGYSDVCRVTPVVPKTWDVTLRRSQPWPHGPGWGLRAWRYQAFKGWVARMSWVDVAWIVTAVVVMAAAAGTVFLLGVYVFDLF